MVAVLQIQAIAVLVCVAQRVAGVIEGLIRHSGKKVRKAGESDPPTGVLFEDLLNACTPEFTTELHVVFIDLPGEAVNELIIGVHAVPRVARSSAELGKETSGSRRRRGGKNDGQAGRVARSGCG